MVQVSALPFAYGRQSYTVSVGALPYFTYMSMSPAPPLVTNFRPVAPMSAGICIVKLSELPAVAARPVTGTPFCRLDGGGGGGGGGVPVSPSGITPPKKLDTCGQISSMRAPVLLQPPRWCSAITLLLERASTGEPELPPSVSQV